MSDIAQLENELLAAVASAKDEVGLEAARVAAKVMPTRPATSPEK